MPKKKNKRQRRRGAVIYTPIAILLIAVIAIFGVSVFFRVASIKVSGAEKYPVESIIKASGIQIGDNLIFINKNTVVEAIKQKLPYLSDVVVEKSIPNTINMKVTETKSLAVIQIEGDWWIVDQKARALEKTDSEGLSGKIRITGLSPVVAGEGTKVGVAEGDKTKLQYLINVLSALDEAGISDKVQSLDISSGTNITFELSERYSVLLGNGENVPHKIDRMQKIIATLGDDERGRIDVSRDDDPAHFIPN